MASGSRLPTIGDDPPDRLVIAAVRGSLRLRPRSFAAMFYHRPTGWKRPIANNHADLLVTHWGLGYAGDHRLRHDIVSTAWIIQLGVIMDPVVIPIDGTLDLHTFAPGELKALLNDYLDACLEHRIYDLRIIHGKGRGVLRERVRSLLTTDPRVRTVDNAPADAGGWGATLVTLKKVGHD